MTQQCSSSSSSNDSSNQFSLPVGRRFAEADGAAKAEAWKIRRLLNLNMHGVKPRDVSDRRCNTIPRDRNVVHAYDSWASAVVGSHPATRPCLGALVSFGDEVEEEAHSPPRVAPAADHQNAKEQKKGVSLLLKVQGAPIVEHIGKISLECLDQFDTYVTFAIEAAKDMSGPATRDHFLDYTILAESLFPEGRCLSLRNPCVVSLGDGFTMTVYLQGSLADITAVSHDPIPISFVDADAVPQVSGAQLVLEGRVWASIAWHHENAVHQVQHSKYQKEMSQLNYAKKAFVCVMVAIKDACSYEQNALKTLLQNLSIAEQKSGNKDMSLAYAIVAYRVAYPNCPSKAAIQAAATLQAQGNIQGAFFMVESVADEEKSPVVEGLLVRLGLCICAEHEKKQKLLKRRRQRTAKHDKVVLLKPECLSQVAGAVEAMQSKCLSRAHARARASKQHIAATTQADATSHLLTPRLAQDISSLKAEGNASFHNNDKTFQDAITKWHGALSVLDVVHAVADALALRSSLWDKVGHELAATDKFWCHAN
jgi:thioesterase domain-containing protein